MELFYVYFLIGFLINLLIVQDNLIMFKVRDPKYSILYYILLTCIWPYVVYLITKDHKDA